MGGDAITHEGTIVQDKPDERRGNAMELVVIPLYSQSSLSDGEQINDKDYLAKEGTPRAPANTEAVCSGIEELE